MKMNPSLAKHMNAATSAQLVLLLAYLLLTLRVRRAITLEEVAVKGPAGVSVPSSFDTVSNGALSTVTQTSFVAGTSTLAAPTSNVTKRIICQGQSALYIDPRPIFGFRQNNIVLAIKRRPGTNFVAVAGQTQFVGGLRVNGVGLYDTVGRTWSALPGLDVPGDVLALTWSTNGTRLYIGGQANMFGSNSFIMYDLTT